MLCLIAGSIIANRHFVVWAVEGSVDCYSRVMLHELIHNQLRLLARPLPCIEVYSYPKALHSRSRSILNVVVIQQLRYFVVMRYANASLVGMELLKLVYYAQRYLSVSLS